MLACWKFSRRGSGFGGIKRYFVGGFAGLFLLVTALNAAEVADGQRELQAGNYAKAIALAESALVEAPGNEDWHLVLVQSLLAVGRYADADTAVTAAVSRFPLSLRCLWAAREAALALGRAEQAAKYVEDIRRLYSNRPWAYRGPADLVVFGRAALALGADPKDVLERVFAVVQKNTPKLRDVYLARGEVALEKHDFALAAKIYEEGLAQLPDDPDLNYGLARAHVEGERPAMLAALKAALKQNPRHIPSLLLIADHRIDEENYPEAEKILAEIVGISPQQPDAWALRAVLAHLRNDPSAELSARVEALRSWPTNPRVDWLIGKKLSEKYRFAEGAARQRRALSTDPDYLPAKAQLASDLLRLGETAEGWELARAVHDKDGYDVEAYNLVTLHDSMAKYVSLTSDDFVVRMTEREAAIYGPQVLDLLGRAKKRLTEKYGAELAKPTYIEIFADPKDFAVRTFGMPDVAGFLGVCFGRVVTANSPASTAARGTNWQSVLWHEFCHVVTLQLTQNKMPRWLSEGISVYEERQANPSWGQQMTPRYREMILGEDLTPVGKMSAAFLTPPSPQHLQFAYYQASLVVEFLLAQHGADKMKALLGALREGTDINRALEREIAPLAKIEKEFAAFARERAKQLGADLDWTKPAPELLRPGAEADFAQWRMKHPDNYWGLLQQAHRLIDENKWAEAKVPLQRLLDRYPDQRDADSALRLLASVHRALNETELERATLTKLAAIDYEAPDAYLRLMELGTAAQDWPTVRLNAERFLQVNPLIAPPYRYLAEASAALDDAPAAIAANRTLLRLDPANPGEVHFRLAELLHRGGEPEAKRQVLLALEESPRNRTALNLLWEINSAPRAGEVAPPTAPSKLP